MQAARSLPEYLRARFVRGVSSPWPSLVALVVALLVVCAHLHAGATDALLLQHTLTLAPFGLVVSRTLFGGDAAREVRALLQWRIVRSPLSYLALYLAAFVPWFVGMSVITVASARTLQDPGLGRDLFTTFGVALLGAAAYAPLAAWAATFRRGPWLLPLVDILVGAIPGVGLLLPSPHLRSLFGGERAAPFGEVLSSCYLLVFAAAVGLLVRRRMRRWMP